MAAPNSLAEFLTSARQIFNAALVDRKAGGRRTVPRYALHQLESECSDLPVLKRLASDVGETTPLEVKDALRRCGVFACLARGEEVDLDAVWNEITTRLRNEEKFFGALQLQGMSMEPVKLSLADGFELQRFDAKTWEAMQPDVDEQLNTEIVVEQVFLMKPDTRVLPARRFFYSPPRKDVPPQRDVLWTLWWRPLLALALYKPEDFRVGVRIEITPKWRLRKSGDFEGEYLPWDEQEGETVERWQNSIPDNYEVKRDDGSALSTFALALEGSLTKAIDLHGDRIQIAAKRFLDAAFRLPGYLVSGWHPDEDETERILLDLVRVADGLLEGGTEEKFVNRAGFVRGDGRRSEKRLKKAYQVRSQLAHGSPPRGFPDLWLLHEDVRFIFLGYLGLAECYARRRVMINALDAGAVPPEGRALQRLARPSIHRPGYPRRRST